ncbi:MAG: hypothetical protein CL678_03535 [Bdellovibrionaceae bacterium]|nr:hypothetical protein [Pseudobdellovibrionaceae bacterium]
MIKKQFELVFTIFLFSLSGLAASNKQMDSSKQMRTASSGISHCVYNHTTIQCMGGVKAYSFFRNVKFNKIKEVKISSNFGKNACILDQDYLRCYSEYPGHRIKAVPSDDVIDYGVTDAQICVLRKSSGLSCSGPFEDAAKELKLVNPTKLAVSFQMVCVIDHDDVDADGLKCIGNKNLNFKVPQGLLVAPEDIQILADWDAAYLCALDQSIIKCWGNGIRGKRLPKVLEALSLKAGERVKRFWLGSFNLACFEKINGRFGCVADPYLEESVSMEVPFQNIAHLSVGGVDACATSVEGVSQCWGLNYFGQNNIMRALSNPKKLYSGAYETCLIDDNGQACWGRNNLTYSYRSDYLIPKSAKFSALFLPRMGGARKGCGVSHGKLTCWGMSDFLESGEKFDQVKTMVIDSGFYDDACVVDHNGLQCFKREDPRKTPAGLGSQIKEMSVDKGRYCATQNNFVHCWEYDSEENIVNEVVQTLSAPHSLSSGANQTCVIDHETVYCWDKSGSKIQVPNDIEGVEKLSVGEGFACASGKDWTKCWGDSEIEVPKKVSQMASMSIVAGHAHACAIGSDQKVYCWGKPEASGVVHTFPKWE